MGNIPLNSFQDAHEFMQLILGSVECTSLNFRCSSVVRCNTCGGHTSTPEESLGIQVAIDPTSSGTIVEYMESYFEPEAVDLFCTTCQRSISAFRQIQPLFVPCAIAVHLKRFKWNGVRLEKIRSFINCPLSIMFLSQKFDLVSCVSHLGSVSSGHYVNFSKRSGSWFKLNDNNVQKCNESEIITSDTYILFYQKGYSGVGGPE